MEGFKRGGKYVYYDKILALPMSKEPVLVINYRDIESLLFDSAIGEETKELSTFIVQTPADARNAFEEAVRTLVKAIDPDFDVNSIKVRFIHVPIELEIPEIRVDHSGKIITVTGIVNMIEQKGALVTKAAYHCQECSATTYSPSTHGLTHKPVNTCSTCNGHSLYLDDTSSEKETFQRISIQQMHDRVDPGAMAEDVECWMVGDDLVNRVMPGERVRVTGVVKLKQKMGKRTDNSRFDYYIEVSSVQSLHEEELQVEDEKLQEQVENAIRTDHEEEDFDKLVQSICPTIKGEDDIKGALLLQLVGSEAWIQPDGSRVRGDINILLVGDPGTGKTTFMRWQKRVPKRAVYVTGRGFSKAGLTAAVVREEGSLPRILPGAYMLADRGVCVVDEIEKTNPDDREVLPSLMDDQQIFNLSKFGINKELAIRSSSLHGCNPIGDRYDIGKTLSENVSFASWLFDRYDMKFVLRNIPNEDKDKEVSGHTKGMMMKGVSERELERKEKELNVVAGVHSIQFMKAWVAYVKKTFDPQPTQEAMDFITDYYRDLRKDSRFGFNITMREMGTLFRLARASARAHMRHVVTTADVQFGINLLAASLRTYGIDPATGDLSSKYIVVTPRDKKLMARLLPTLKQLLVSLAGQSGKETFSEEDVIDKMTSEGFPRADVQNTLHKFMIKGALREPKTGYYQIVWSGWK